MISLGWFMVCASLIFAFFLFRDFKKLSSNLLTKIQRLSPGQLTDRPSKSGKRLRRLPKSLALQADRQLTEILDLLVAMLFTGESLIAALDRVLKSAAGPMAAELRLMLQKVELGGRIDSELIALCERVPTPSVREFSNKLSLAISRGTPLSGSLLALAQSIRAKQSTNTLKLAGSNETKMLIPVVLLICPVTVIFALYPSTQLLNLATS